MAEGDFLRSRLGPKWRKVFSLLENPESLQYPEQIVPDIVRAQISRLREARGVPYVGELVNAGVQWAERIQRGDPVSAAEIDRCFERIVAQAGGNLNTG